MIVTGVLLIVIAVVGTPVAIWAYFGGYWDELRELNRKGKS